MKETYIIPIIEVITFQSEDIITSSPKELEPLGSE